MLSLGSLFLETVEKATCDCERKDLLLLPGAMPQFDKGGAAAKERNITSI